MHGRDENAYKFLIENLKGRDNVGDFRRRWEDNMKIDRKEIRCKDMRWIHLAQDRVHLQAVVNIVTTLQAP
jgi:hypothetical protein